MSLGVTYLRQPICSAWLSTAFALSNGSFTSNGESEQVCGARMFNKNVYASPSCNEVYAVKKYL